MLTLHKNTWRSLSNTSSLKPLDKFTKECLPNIGKHKTAKPTDSHLRCFCRRRKSLYVSPQTRTHPWTHTRAWGRPASVSASALPVLLSESPLQHPESRDNDTHPTGLRGQVNSTVPGTQHVDNKGHCNQESTVPSLAIGSLSLVYSPPERRLQTFLTCHQAQTQKPKDTMSLEFLLLLVPGDPQTTAVSQRTWGRSRHPSMVSFLLDTAHPTPASPALRGAT